MRWYFYEYCELYSPCVYNHDKINKIMNDQKEINIKLNKITDKLSI